MTVSTPTTIQIDRLSAIKPPINLVKFQKNSLTPTSQLSIIKQNIQVLWDTGSAINCMSYELAIELDLEVDRKITLDYTDVNKNTKRSYGLTNINKLS